MCCSRAKVGRLVSEKRTGRSSEWKDNKEGGTNMVVPRYPRGIGSRSTRGHQHSGVLRFLILNGLAR